MTDASSSNQPADSLGQLGAFVPSVPVVPSTPVPSPESDPWDVARAAEEAGAAVAALEEKITQKTGLQPEPEPVVETGFDGAERRAAPRHKSQALFAIAPYHPDRPLDQTEFAVVRGRNVSRTGVGLLSETRCDEADIAIVMAAPGIDPIYVHAQVTHCTDIGETDGKSLYLIGCRFVRRLQG